MWPLCLVSARCCAHARTVTSQPACLCQEEKAARWVGRVDARACRGAACSSASLCNAAQVFSIVCGLSYTGLDYVWSASMIKALRKDEDKVKATESHSQ